MFILFVGVCPKWCVMLQARFTLSFITAKRLPVSPAAVRPAQLGGDSSTGSLLPWAQSQSVGSPISVLPRGGRSTPYIIPCPGTGSHCSQRLWRHAAGCCCEALLQPGPPCRAPAGSVPQPGELSVASCRWEKGLGLLNLSLVTA